jgi:hypothetical protein
MLKMYTCSTILLRIGIVIDSISVCDGNIVAGMVEIVRMMKMFPAALCVGKCVMSRYAYLCHLHDWIYLFGANSFTYILAFTNLCTELASNCLALNLSLNFADNTNNWSFQHC